MKSLLIGIALAATAGQPVPLTGWHRLSEKPIISPGPGQFDVGAAYNPTALKEGSKTILLYRGQDKNWTSSVDYAESTDGIHFVKASAPLMVPKEAYEKDGGLEDPRIVKIDGTYYLTYTGWNKKDAQLCLATSRDLKTWTRRGPIMPANKGAWNCGWTKSGAIVPEKIQGKYWMYYMGTPFDRKADEMGLAVSTDLLHWKDATDKPILPRRENAFDKRVMEPGPAPILTDQGILLIYNGADEKIVYRAGWLLFDRNDPRKLIARSEHPFFEPEKDWEKKGQVPNVVFVEGMVKDGDRYIFYYGGADKYVGAAECKLDLKALEALVKKQ